MDSKKKQQLLENGWVVTTVQALLDLSTADMESIEIRLEQSNEEGLNG